MFGINIGNENDAVNILKKDHQKVKDLFREFEYAENSSEKKRIAENVIRELKIHTAIEEEIFYPAVRSTVGHKIMDEAEEEHHVAKILIAELEKMSANEELFDAKFTVLAENIRHHIKEEEGVMLPEVRSGDINFEALGLQLLARKKDLMRTGVPASPEEKMVVGRSKAAASRELNPSGKSAKTRGPRTPVSGRKHTGKDTRPHY